MTKLDKKDKKILYELDRNARQPLSKIAKKVTPHTLRHTFATHLIKQGENLVVLRDLLGHRQISSTQIYLHMTAEDIRSAIDRHPIKKLLNVMWIWFCSQPRRAFARCI